MIRKYGHSLQRSMIIYFLLIGFASCLVGVEFIVDTNNKELRTQLSENFNRLSKGEIEHNEAFHPIDVLRNKAVIMVGVILVVVIIVLSMLIKNITEPLQHMIEVSKEISRGDLSQTVSINTMNELSELGAVINELTSNLQELLLLSKDLCRSGEKFIQGLSEFADCGNPQCDALKQIADEKEALLARIRTLSNIIEGFQIFRIGH